MVDGIVTVHDAEHILGTMESVCLVSPLCALHYRAFQKQLLGAKASARRPKQVFHLSSKTIASLAWWVSPAGFAAYASAPIGNWTSLLSYGQMLVWSMGKALVLMVALFKGLGLLVVWLMILAQTCWKLGLLVSL